MQYFKRYDVKHKITKHVDMIYMELIENVKSYFLASYSFSVCTLIWVV